MISKFVNWLFSPETKAKKRTLIVFMGSMAGGLIAAKPMVDFACGDSTFILCSVNLVLVSDAISKLTVLISSPEMGGIGFITGLYAIYSGFKKDVKKTEQKNG